jgi:hypothetical protein
MRNLFDINRAVAESYVRAQQTKGWFLATAQGLLVVLSGTFLFLGVFMIALGENLGTIMDIAMAIVSGVLAITIEGGTILSAAVWDAEKKNIEKQVAVLYQAQNKAKDGKKPYTEEEFQAKVAKVKRGQYKSLLIMLMCVGFSVCGAEIFWQKFLAGQSVLLHVIGAILGVVCSSLLLFFEFKKEHVKQAIEDSITSSSLIQLALDQSAKSDIFKALFKARRDKLKSSEFQTVITQASEKSLYGVLGEAIEMAGLTVSAESLQREVEDQKEVRAAADAMVANSGDTEPLLLPQQGGNIRSLKEGRDTPQRKAVRDAIKQHGRGPMMQDTAKFAEKLGMDERTLTRWLRAEQV